MAGLCHILSVVRKIDAAEVFFPKAVVVKPALDHIVSFFLRYAQALALDLAVQLLHIVIQRIALRQHVLRDLLRNGACLLAPCLAVHASACKPVIHIRELSLQLRKLHAAAVVLQKLPRKVFDGLAVDLSCAGGLLLLTQIVICPSEAFVFLAGRLCILAHLFIQLFKVSVLFLFCIRLLLHPLDFSEQNLIPLFKAFPLLPQYLVFPFQRLGFLRRLLDAAHTVLLDRACFL